MYCATCGTPLAPGLSYCNRCGASLKEPSESHTKSIAAFLTAITLIGLIGMGIMLGGMLEYASLLTGYRNLLLIVIAFYIVSALLLRGRIRRPEREAEAETSTRVPVAAAKW